MPRGRPKEEDIELHKDPLGQSRAGRRSPLKQLPASWSLQQKSHQLAWLPPSLGMETGFSRDTRADAVV